MSPSPFKPLCSMTHYSSMVAKSRHSITQLQGCVAHCVSDSSPAEGAFKPQYYLVRLSESSHSLLIIGTATTVDTIDLSQRFNIGNTELWKHIAKNTTASKPGPPSLNNGAIFSNGSSLWLYGGARNNLPSRTDDSIPPNGIWRYDIAAGQWSQPSPGGDPVQRLYRGTFTQAGSSTAFYLGGIKSPRGDASFYAELDAQDYLVQGLIAFDESMQRFSNVSTTGLNLHGTANDGFLTCIETLGTKGTLQSTSYQLRRRLRC